MEQNFPLGILYIYWFTSYLFPAVEKRDGVYLFSILKVV